MALDFQTHYILVPEYKGNKDTDPSEQIRAKTRTLSVNDMLEVNKATGVNVFGKMSFDMEKPEEFAKNWGLIEHIVAERYRKHSLSR